MVKFFSMKHQTMKTLRLTINAIAVLGIGAAAALYLGGRETARLRTKVVELEQQTAALEQQKVSLQDSMRRLCAARRVAQLNVIEQLEDDSHHVVNRLRWQEIGAGGVLGEPVLVEALGKQVYFEGLVIKFTHDDVGQGDPDRGESLVMFHRIFGEMQAPALARVLHPLPAPGDPGAAGLGDHAELWARFWELLDDPDLAAREGVRIAQVEAPAVRLRQGQVWEATLDAAGGLNLRRLSEAPDLAGR